MKITLRAIDGKSESFTVTPEHPFLTPKSPNGHQWAAISGFAVGDQIATAIGEPVTITAIEPLEGQREVFNLTIAEDHSYAIGELGVWGHNGKWSRAFATALHLILAFPPDKDGPEFEDYNPEEVSVQACEFKEATKKKKKKQKRKRKTKSTGRS